MRGMHPMARRARVIVCSFVFVDTRQTSTDWSDKRDSIDYKLVHNQACASLARTPCPCARTSALVGSGLAPGRAQQPELMSSLR